jgi:hypothetical protein
LNGFVTSLSEATKALDRRDFSEAKEVIRGLMTDLEDLRARYEEALKAHRIRFPY